MDDTSPPCDPIYSLSEVEQLALPEFLDENLMNQFHLSHSSTGAPRPFYQEEGRSPPSHYLNKITKKDRYQLLLIPGLLDRLRSARVFSKLDLRGAYNLVRIADGGD
jgi:hypothetical protein